MANSKKTLFQKEAVVLRVPRKCCYILSILLNERNKKYMPMYRKLEERSHELRQHTNNEN